MRGKLLLPGGGPSFLRAIAVRVAALALGCSLWMARSSSASPVPVGRTEPIRASVPAPSMVRLPAVTIAMGSSADEILVALALCAKQPYASHCRPELFEDEFPEHRQAVNSFWMHRREVTVSAFHQCVRQGSCAARPSSLGVRRRERPQHPVSRVNWYEARNYCHSIGARLPSEAEFERAARGPSGRRFPWGTLFNRRVANVGRFGWVKTDSTDGYRDLAPVGSFPAGATPEGIVDMAGNVAEWVADSYVLYEVESGSATAPSMSSLVPLSAPRSSGHSSVKVIRGGSYRSSAAAVRGSARNFAPPSERSESVGFRCARSALGTRER